MISLTSHPAVALCLLLAACAICGTTLPLYAQQTAEETLLEEQQDSSEQSQLLEQIASLREQPLELNRANRQDLEMIPGLSTHLIDAILAFRKSQKRLRNVAQLRNLSGMNPTLFEYLQRVLVVEQRRAARAVRSQVQWRSRASSRRENPIGYRDGSYESGKEKIYNRGKFNIADRITGGILLEKDAGEKRLDDLKLFFVRANLMHNVDVLVGDFQLQAGQGLVVWGPYGFAKGANTVYPVKRRATGIRGYLSVDENAALHGIATRIQISKLRFQFFVSRSSLDATLLSDNSIQSLGTSGFHRTANELAMKDAVVETSVGGRIEAQPFRGLRLGATGYSSTYNKELSDSDFERNHFKLRGDRNHVTGFDWHYEHAGLAIFGEAARSRSGGAAVVGGATVDLRSVRLAILVRDFHRNFQNLHGLAFGERGDAPQNERGTYLGLEYHLSETASLKAYYDIYAFPWRTHLQPLPVLGNDFLALFEQKYGRDLVLGIRLRHKSRQQVQELLDPQSTGVEKLVKRSQRQIRLQIDYRISKQLRARGRIETTRISYDGYGQDLDSLSETGLLLYQDVRFNPSKKIRFAGRLIFFHTGSFDSRVYQYENDLPGLLTNRALFGRGTRWYILARYRPFDGIALHAKYSELFKEGSTQIGGGKDAITGNLDRRFALQLDLNIR